MDNAVKQIKEIIEKNLPSEVEITSIELEGPEVAIYTKNPKSFFENENYVAKLAYELKKRVNVRSDKSLLINQEEAKKIIEGIVPQDAGIKEIYFDEAFSEVVIEAMKPGLVIGKSGSTSKEIILRTGWVPNILRAPTSESKTLRGIRHHLHKYSAERRKILQATAKHIYRELPEQLNNRGWIKLDALGGFREVGRSCILIATANTKVMLDCGINVASNDDPYPYLDSLNNVYRQLREFNIGDTIKTTEGDGIIVEKSVLIDKNNPMMHNQIVYNFQMKDGPPSYIVNGAVVHNGGGGK